MMIERLYTSRKLIVSGSLVVLRPLTSSYSRGSSFPFRRLVSFRFRFDFRFRSLARRKSIELVCVESQ